MNDSPEVLPIKYGICAASDAEEMTHLLADVFTRRDPLAGLSDWSLQNSSLS